MKIFQFWLIFAVESYRYQRYNAKKAAAKPQMMIRDADGVSFHQKCNKLTPFWVIFSRK